MTIPRAIDVLVFDSVNIVDVAGPVQAFDDARINGAPAYRLRYLSPDGEPARASCGLRLAVDGSIAEHAPDADLLVPGGDVDPLLGHEEIGAAIRAQARRG